MAESVDCWVTKSALSVQPLRHEGTKNYLRIKMAKKKKTITLISWNVNGLRAAIKKNFSGSFQQMNADIVALQEIKLQEPQLTDEMNSVPGYESCWSYSTVKKGYSGVATYSRMKPKRIKHGIGLSLIHI